MGLQCVFTTKTYSVGDKVLILGKCMQINTAKIINTFEMAFSETFGAPANVIKMTLMLSLLP